MIDATLWFRLVEHAADGGALLVHLALKATLLLLVLFVVASGLRRASAALRHTLWLVCCLGLLLLPAFTIALPAWQPIAVKPLTASPVAQSTVVQETTFRLLKTMVTGHTDSAPIISTWQWIFASLFACWLLGAVAVAQKLAAGFLNARRLQSRGRPVNEGQLWEEFRVCAESVHVRAPAATGAPRLLLVDDDALLVPLTWGWWHPVVLMPRSCMQWAVSCRRAALLHELSHIRRLDWLVQSLASLTCLLYWFHPIVWFAARRLRFESERATDDHVLATGFNATDYSSSLLEIVRLLGSYRGSGANQKDSLMKFAVPLSGTSKLETRLRSILDPKQSRSAVTKKLLAAIALGAVATIVPLAAAKEPAEAQVPATPQGPTVLTGKSQTPRTYVREGFVDAGTGERTAITRELTEVEGPAVWREVFDTPAQTPDESNRVLYGGNESVQVSRIIYPAKKRVVTGFKFSGNTLLKDEELQKALVSKTGVVLSPQAFSADVSAIQTAYYYKGLSARVKDATQDDAGVISYNLLENRTVKPAVTGFKFTGNTLLKDEDLKKVLVSKTGVVFDQKNFVADFIAIRKAYAEKGADVDMKNSTQDEAGVVSYNLVEHRAATGFKFSGNTLLKGDDLQKALVSKIGVVSNPQDFSADVAAIRKAYADKGLSAYVKSVTQDDAGVVSYNVVEFRSVEPVTNEPLKKRVVTGFKFSGNVALKADDLQKVLVSKMGVVMDRQSLVRDAIVLQKAYSDKGFAVIVTNAAQDDSGVISYTLLEARLTQIKLTGLTKIDSESVRKLITTPVNEPFDASKLRRDLSRVYDTKLFEDATFKIDDDPNAPGGVIATFLLKEKNATP